MVSSEPTPLAPVVPPPQPSPTRLTVWAARWTVIGCLALVAAVALWLVGNFGWGVSWQDTRLPNVAEGQTWSVNGVSLTTHDSMHGTTISIPDEDAAHATDGAYFVAVTVDYVLASEDVNQVCSLMLVGDGRTWLSTDVTASVTITDAVPGVTTGCSNTDANGDPTTNGTMGALFEVPEAALSEIHAVQATVQQSFDWTQANTVQQVFASPSESALLQITIQ